MLDTVQKSSLDTSSNHQWRVKDDSERDEQFSDAQAKNLIDQLPSDSASVHQIPEGDSKGTTGSYQERSLGGRRKAFQ